MRSLWIGLAVLIPLLQVTAAQGQRSGRPSVDPRLLDELERDVERFAGAVREYRENARTVIRREYIRKGKEIRSKYADQVSKLEKEERDRRRDAIAVFEAFLRRYPNDPKWTPDAMFRLAELYYERSSEQFLAAQESYQKSLDGASSADAMAEAPRADYSPTIDLYKRLITQFPNYRFLDASYYLLGYCLGEMNQVAEARQVLLALVCANEYKPLEPPASLPPASVADAYAACQPVGSTTKFLPEAWTRIGEIHFEEPNELHLAVSAYKRVLNFPASPYFDKALYKLAWAYYRDNRFKEAVEQFDKLVKFADEKKAAGDKVGSDLRPEAVQYLAISFSEADWDGDGLPDLQNGLERAQAFYKGREGEPHVKEIYQRLGDIYFDTTKYPEAVAVYKAYIKNWPYDPDAPKVQEKVVRAFERDRNLAQAGKERELLGKQYAEGSEWYRQNQDNAEAVATAKQLAEDALLTAATNVHANAQSCRSQWQSDPSDIKRLLQCRDMYRSAAELYAQYLTTYPNSKRGYEFSYFYAEALFYSDNLEEAALAYQKVRDSNMDNRYQEEAAFQMIKAYEATIEKMKLQGQLEEPPIPSEQNTRPPVVAQFMPEVYQKYMEAIDWYVGHINSDRTADLKYFTAVLALRYRNWPDARKRLFEVTELYCGSKPVVGFKAYDAILQTYFIDYNIDSAEQKDCALGQLLEVAERFSASPCSRAPQAAPYLARFNQIKSDVKTKVITDRLQLALENEEKGTNRQLTMCQSGMGGIAKVMGMPDKPATTTAQGGAKPEQPSKLSTELDEGLALDLIDVVNASPKDENAPTALNNACVIYEKLYKFGEATRCYERLYRDYPDHGLARDALWNASRNHSRFFNFDQAVQGYLTIADSPKFRDYENRRQALGLAAQLLDNDQQYPKAADLYRRYADAIADEPQDSAQAYYKACAAYEKARDVGKQTQCLNQFIARYRKEGPAGSYVVQARMQLAKITAATSRKEKDVFDAYKLVMDEFRARGLPPATAEAAAAAESHFLLLERKFEDFKAKRLVFTSRPEQVKKTFDAFTDEAKALNAEYEKVWEYKDATWTLAAFLRSGDIYFEFAQKLIKAADNPPDDIKQLARKACRANPDDCGLVEAQYKDAIFQFVTPIEEEAKKRWRDTLDRASQLGVTNRYVKKARENLSKYLPDEFPDVKDEKIALETP